MSACKRRPAENHDSALYVHVFVKSSGGYEQSGENAYIVSAKSFFNKIASCVFNQKIIK